MSRFTMLILNAFAVIIVLFCQAAAAQTTTTKSRFYSNNVKRIDSFILFLKTYCHSVKPVTITNKSVRQDKENMRYISQVYNAPMSYKEFMSNADKNDLVQSQN